MLLDFIKVSSHTYEVKRKVFQGRGREKLISLVLESLQDATYIGYSED